MNLMMITELSYKRWLSSECNTLLEFGMYENYPQSRKQSRQFSPLLIFLLYFLVSRLVKNFQHQALTGKGNIEKRRRRTNVPDVEPANRVLLLLLQSCFSKVLMLTAVLLTSFLTSTQFMTDNNRRNSKYKTYIFFRV